MRTQMRRFTSLTKVFSKKVETLNAAVSLHFAHYDHAPTQAPACSPSHDRGRQTSALVFAGIGRRDEPL